MSKRRVVDTNLIVRHLVQDHPKHAKAAGKLFEACDRGEVLLVILPAVLAECVFVLESFYRHPRERICHTLSQLVTSPGIELTDLVTHLDALQRYRKTRVHFVDCVIAAMAVHERVPVATFDDDFRKFGDVKIELEA